MTTYTALYYHLVWSTKNREATITEIVQPRLHAYIAGVIRSNQATPIQIGGMPDHIHILIRMNPDHNISDIVKRLKISSGNWLKEQSPSFHGFAWQKGFGAFSVSKSQTEVVKRYIQNQKEHHKDRGFDDEWLTFLQSHDIEYKTEYAFG